MNTAEGLAWGGDVAGKAPAPDDLRVVPFGDRAWLVEPIRPAPHDWAVELAARAEAAWPHCQLIPGLASLLIARSLTWDGAADHASSHASESREWPRTAAEVRTVLSADSATPGLPALPLASPVRRGLARGGVEDPGSGRAASLRRPGLDQGRRTHVLTARYDGPDLAAAADQAGLSQTALVARHVATEWTVAAVGFSPGFGYLTCGDPVFAAIARHRDPRPRVPAGAIALAAGMCAVYPSPTPGGWQLVGTTDAVLWDPAEVPPAQLRVGDRVRFEATT